MSAYSVLVQCFFCQIQHNPNLAIEKVSSVKQVYPTDTRGLYYEAGFSLSGLTSGKSLAFRSYDAGSLFSRLDFHGNLC